MKHLVLVASFLLGVSIASYQITGVIESNSVPSLNSIATKRHPVDFSNTKIILNQGEHWAFVDNAGAFSMYFHSIT